MRLFLITVVVCASLGCTWGIEYKALLQPELDSLKVDDYVKNERNLKLQFNCLVNDGPCDAVGRWLKPRLAKGLLGECIKCTPIQAASLQRVNAYVAEHHPEYFRSLITKYVFSLGIPVPPGIATIGNEKNQSTHVSTSTGKTTASQIHSE